MSDKPSGWNGSGSLDVLADEIERSGGYEKWRAAGMHVCPRCGERVEDGTPMNEGCRDPDCPEDGIRYADAVVTKILMEMMRP